MFRIPVYLIIGLLLQHIDASQPTRLHGFFRSGQTFLTWGEDIGQTGEKYRVYRSLHPITSSDLNSANQIAEIAEGSSFFIEMHKCGGALHETLSCYIDRYVIEPVSSGKGTELSDTTGLFVWTTHEEYSVTAYYAVTTVSSGGVEETALSTENTAGPITETRQHPDAVRYFVGPDNGEDQRDYYILWMDYVIWKESYTGYATPFAISNKCWGGIQFTGNQLENMHLDGITSNFPGAAYSYYGNMDFDQNGQPSWYFGYHASKNYEPVCNSSAGAMMADTIANYVQYKHMQAVLWAKRHFNITKPQFGIEGNSMGGSGAYGFLMAFPSFVTGVYCHDGLIQYRDPGRTGSSGLDTIWKQSIHRNYGHPTLGNPVKFLPFNDPDYPELDWITHMNGTNVYDVRDVVKFMSEHIRTSFGYLSASHKFDDLSIQWSYNGEPFENFIKDSRQSFSYGCGPGDHGWQGHVGENIMWQKMRTNESRPGFSGVEPVIDTLGNRKYLVDVTWGTLDGAVLSGQVISETETSWTLPIKSATSFTTVDITPRNLQSLKVCEGDTFTYSIMSASQVVESTGEIVGDNLDLLLIPGVPIRPAGTVLQVTLRARGSNYPCADDDPPMRSQAPATDAHKQPAKLSAFPNPFNPVVSISLNIGGHANIYIYNIAGRMVADLTGVFKNRAIVWNASGMPSGIYVVHACVAGKVLTKQIALIK